MNFLISLFVVLIGLLQTILLVSGLWVGGALLFPKWHSSDEKRGSFDLWGAWHLVVIIILCNVVGLQALADKMSTVQSVMPMEDLKVVMRYVGIPLLMSLALSRAHMHMR